MRWSCCCRQHCSLAYPSNRLVTYPSLCPDTLGLTTYRRPGQAMRSTDVVESLYVMELAYAAPDRELDRQCPVGRSVGGYPLQGRGFRRAHIGRGVIVRVRLPERSHEVVNKHKLASALHTNPTCGGLPGPTGQVDNCPTTATRPPSDTSWTALVLYACSRPFSGRIVKPLLRLHTKGFRLQTGSEHEGQLNCWASAPPCRRLVADLWLLWKWVRR